MHLESIDPTASSSEAVQVVLSCPTDSGLCPACAGKVRSCKDGSGAHNTFRVLGEVTSNCETSGEVSK